MKWFLSTLQQLSVLCSCEAVKVIDAQCTESNVCLATGIAAKTLPHRSPLVTHRSGPMRAQAWASLCSHLLSLTPLPCAVITWRARHMLRLTVGVSRSHHLAFRILLNSQINAGKHGPFGRFGRLPPKNTFIMEKLQSAFPSNQCIAWFTVSRKCLWMLAATSSNYQPGVPSIKINHSLWKPVISLVIAIINVWIIMIQ